MAFTEVYFDQLKEISDNCYLIEKGVRSCYLGVVTGPSESYDYGTSDDKHYVYSLDEKLKEIEKMVKSYDLHFAYYKKKTEEWEDHERADIWIYKYPHQGHIIKMIANDESYYSKEWIVGKLLGYGDEAMEEFLTKEFPR